MVLGQIFGGDKVSFSRGSRRRLLRRNNRTELTDRNFRATVLISDCSPTLFGLRMEGCRRDGASDCNQSKTDSLKFSVSPVHWCQILNPNPQYRHQVQYIRLLPPKQANLLFLSLLKLMVHALDWSPLNGSIKNRTDKKPEHLSDHFSL